MKEASWQCVLEQRRRTLRAGGDDDDHVGDGDAGASSRLRCHRGSMPAKH